MEMTTKTIQGDWIMKKDEIIEESLLVEGNISGKNGNRYNLIVKGDLNCRDLNCRDLNCRNLNCRNLDCWDLKCWDLNCLDLDFYAVAFSYNSFKCKSVKGRRENSKYFCLDKEVEVTG
jgi:hypothetical protein